MTGVGNQSETERGLSVFGDLSSVTIAAHELKAPLALMRQLSLEMQNLAPGSANTTMLAHQIQLVSERTLRFTSNLTKAQTLQTTLFTTSPLNPRQVCDEVVHELRPLYAAHGRQLRYKTNRETSLVVANHDLLRRIMLNFVDNALHYSDDSGVVELYTQLRRSRGVMRLGVRDFGPALPRQLWRQLSKVSVRPQPVHSRPDSSGLGLHIVSQFAGVIGGQVGAIRHRDGATFYIDVPISNQLALL